MPFPRIDQWPGYQPKPIIPFGTEYPSYQPPPPTPQPVAPPAESSISGDLSVPPPGSNITPEQWASLDAYSRQAIYQYQNAQNQPLQLQPGVTPPPDYRPPYSPPMTPEEQRTFQTQSRIEAQAWDQDPDRLSDPLGLSGLEPWQIAALMLAPAATAGIIGGAAAGVGGSTGSVAPTSVTPTLFGGAPASNAFIPGALEGGGIIGSEIGATAIPSTIGGITGAIPAVAGASTLAGGLLPPVAESVLPASAIAPSVAEVTNALVPPTTQPAATNPPANPPVTPPGVDPSAIASGLPDWVGNYLIPGLNSVLGYVASDQASDAQADALQAGIDEQRRQFDTTRTDLMPWLTAGQGALGRLQDPNTNFLASPDYGFRRTEGTRDIGNYFGARGGAASGNALKALNEYNSNLASGEFNDWFNRQSNIAGLGQTTGTQLGQLGANSASNIGNFMAGQGNARASGVLGRYGSLAGGLNDSIYNYLYRRRAA